MGRFRQTITRLGAALCGLALVGVLAVAAPAGAAAPPEAPDYAIPGGHFYTQMGGGKGGFGVRDLAGVRFWSEYVRQGGPEALGYPISRPFWGPGGFLYQAFQHGLLQWRPDAEQTFPATGGEFAIPRDAAIPEALVRPAAEGAPAPVVPAPAAAVAAAASGDRYRVAPRDTLFSIAARIYGSGSAWQQLYEANRDQLRSPNHVEAGMLLRLPGLLPPPPAEGDAGADTPDPEPAAPPLAEDSAGAETPAPAPESAAVADGARYLVAPRDTLFSIAARIYGSASAWRQLYEANLDQLRSPDHVETGMLLRLPGAPAPPEAEGDASADTPAPAPPPAEPAGEERYLVTPHDTLFSIALRLYGTGSAWRQLYETNHDQLRAPDHVEAGMVLRIPR